MDIIKDIDKLRQKSKKTSIKEVNFLYLDSRLRSMMTRYKGLGLSAIQIGIPLRVFTLQLNDGKIETFINPKITKQYEEKTFVDEGCLSFPNRSVNTTRSNFVHIEYLNAVGASRQAVLQGLEAVVFQHELDHLNGIVMFDRESKEFRKPQQQADYSLETEDSI